MTLTTYARKCVPFDPLKDLAPLSNAVDIPLLLVVHSSVPARNLQAFVQYAKAHPAKLNHGCDGLASPAHLNFHMFKQQQDRHVVHIPYCGTAQPTNDMLADTMRSAGHCSPVQRAHVPGPENPHVSTTA